MRCSLLAWTVLILAAGLLCAGCSGAPAPLATPGEPAVGEPQLDETPEPSETVDPGSESEVSVTATPTPAATQPERPADSTPTPGSIEPSLKELANQAREDLARRLSLPAASIEVVEAQSVVWRDGSLGCPEPGMAYTQALVEGTLIHLRAGERDFYYHGGGGRAPFLCERSTRDTGARD
jgi:hypothetical protein